MRTALAPVPLTGADGAARPLEAVSAQTEEGRAGRDALPAVLARVRRAAGLAYRAAPPGGVGNVQTSQQQQSSINKHNTADLRA